MKHTNKKGFTIVELVIVIAVIAILAAVLIPNLSRLATKADESAAMQEAKAAMDDDLINAEGDLENMETYDAIEGKQYYVVSSHVGDASATLVTTEYTLSGKTFTKVSGTGSQVAGTTYYEIKAYEGTYNKGTGTYTVEKAGYTCSFANGEWKIVEK